MTYVIGLLTDNYSYYICVQNSNKHPLKTVYSALFSMMIYGALLLLLAHMIYLDSHNFTDTKLYGENSYTEWAQVIVLALVVLLMSMAAKIQPALRIISILVGGFFLMAFIREFDSRLDMIFDGLWQLLAFSVLGMVGISIYKNKSDLKRPLTTFVNSAPFGMIASGTLITFTFSRLYGEARTWESIMGDSYMRAVKNISEESIELLGYSLVLFGTIEWIKFLLAKQRTNS